MSKWPRPAGTKCGVNAYDGTARSSLDETWYWYDIGRQWSNARMPYVYIFHKKRKGVEEKSGFHEERSWLLKEDAPSLIEMCGDEPKNRHPESS